jgi:ABC-type glycerol-3-phosphate transport system permease component
MRRARVHDSLICFVRSLPRYLVLLLFLIIVAVPVLFIVLGSGKTLAEVIHQPIQWFPRVWQWSNFTGAWNRLPFARWTLNSLIMTICITAGHLILGSMAGYGFSKFTFRGQRAAFLFVLSTMMLPVQVTAISLFMIMKRFGWVNTYQGLITPLLVNAFSVFFMRQYILSLPNDLIDAARMDGAGELRIFVSVVLPLCTPALTGLGVLVALGAWSEFLWPLIISGSDKMLTLPIGLAMFKNMNWSPFNELLAMSVLVSILPCLLFALFQRQLVESGVLTGMK